MRIIAGSAKGKTLTSPPETTRPTSDRAREGFFSSIESEFNLIDGWHVDSISFLDLFAGSGAMGVEALSRGASEVVAVENNEKAIESIRHNAALVDIRFGSFQLQATEVEKYLMQPRVEGFDIIFVDPPYGYSNEEITNILTLIVKNNFLSKRGLIAVERKSKAKEFVWPEGLSFEKLRSYGEGSIYFGGFTQP